MENKLNKNGALMLPKTFKLIGLIIIVLAIVAKLIISYVDFNLVLSQKELFKTLLLNGTILGLLFLSISKDKMEDEMTMAIRLKL